MNNKMEKMFKTRQNPGGMLGMWIIFLLSKRSMNGYEIMKEIQSYTEFWKPATGAIYPTLFALREKGLVKIDKTGNRNQKIYSLTHSGKTMTKQIMDDKIRKFRDPKVRRIVDSFLWPEEPDDIREIFETLHINLFDFRSSLKRKYKNLSHMKKSKDKLNRVIKEIREA